MAWEKGQSGNAGGRPKSKPISDMYRRILADERKLKRFCLAQFRAACKGDTSAARDITDRLEGKPPQTLDVHDTRRTDPGQRLAELFAAAATRNSAADDSGRTQ